jgi:dynactin complex subunit
MSTISILETSTGQEETAILLEEYERRIATLQESLKQAGRIHPNEAVIMQEIKRVVDERDDLKRRLENADILIEHLKDENAGWKRDFDMFDKAQNKASILWREAHPLRDIWPSTGALTEWLMDEVGRLRGLIDNTTAKQPEGTTKLDKALQNIDVVKRVLIENSCPSEFGLEDCECDNDSCCEDCWNGEVTE